MRITPFNLLHLLLIAALGPSLFGCPTDAAIGRRGVAPVVAISAPTDGSFFSPADDPVSLVGSASDNRDGPDDLAIRWELNETELPDGSIDADGNVTGELNVEELEVGAYDLRLIAEDGDGEIGSAEVRIYVATVAITAPEDSSLFESGQSITFQGEAGLGESGASLLNDLNFLWSSSLDGALDGAVSGNGESILVHSSLQAGVHTIDLEVSHSNEATPVGTASIQVTVQPEVVEAEPGDLIFSEFMVDPNVVDDWYGEWVELWNASDFAIDIEGYSFHDDDVDAWTLEGSTVVLPRDYVVLCASPTQPPQTNKSSNGGVPCDAVFYRPEQGSGGGIALANGTDEIALSRPDGEVIDLLEYDGSWYSPGIAIGIDPAFLTADDNDDLSRWCNQSSVITSGGEPGTPGQENDPCTEDR